MGTKRIPRADLLDELRRLADGSDAPTQADLRERGDYSVGVYQQRFGGWQAACEAAGLEPNRPPNEPIPRDELVDALQDLADDLGRTPTKDDVAECGRFATNTYHRNFGSYTAACEAAGLEPNDKASRTARRIQEQIGGVITGLGEPEP